MPGESLPLRQNIYVHLNFTKRVRPAFAGRPADAGRIPPSPPKYLCTFKFHQKGSSRIRGTPGASLANAGRMPGESLPHRRKEQSAINRIKNKK